MYRLEEVLKEAIERTDILARRFRHVLFVL
jgi:Lhr-like helicase